MKIAKLFHNPKAGSAGMRSKNLVKLIEDAGFRCEYTSTKKPGWNEIDPVKTDFIILAGGDGTVRKVAKQILDLHLPIGLLPFGTANNIAKTLGIKGTPEEIVESWKDGVEKPFDVGRIYGLDKAQFFLESLGFGVFPRLMKEMKRREKDLSDKPEENLNLALDVLHDIILQSKARYCKVSIDGADHSGKFLLVEVMNTQSFGPNLHLASFADPGDGTFEVILVSERQREEFAAYVHNKRYGIEQPPIFNVLKAKHLDIYWEGKLLHVDDEIIQMKKSKDVRIKMQEGALKFVTRPVKEVKPTTEETLEPVSR